MEAGEETTSPEMRGGSPGGEDMREPGSDGGQAAEESVVVAVSPSSGLEARGPGGEESKGGCSIQAVLAGAILGGVFGLLLTTFILYFLNGGMLQFAGARSLRALEDDTVTRLNDAQVKRDELVTQMETLNVLIEELNEAVIAVTTQQAEISGLISDTDDQVDELESTVLGFDEKINSAAEAAENFNVFLGGLKELLGEMALTPEADDSGLEEPAVQTGTAEPPAADDDLTPEVTITSSARSTEIRPTRSPRPTGTPIVAQTASP